MPDDGLVQRLKALRVGIQSGERPFDALQNCSRGPSDRKAITELILSIGGSLVAPTVDLLAALDLLVEQTENG